MAGKNPQPDAAASKEAQLAELAERINAAHAEVEKVEVEIKAAGKHGLEHALVAGDALIKAKELVPHGKWGGDEGWLKKKTNVSERTSQVYMQLARHPKRDDIRSAADMGCSIRSILEQIAKDKFNEENDPEFFKFQQSVSRHCDEIIAEAKSLIKANPKLVQQVVDEAVAKADDLVKDILALVEREDA